MITDQGKTPGSAIAALVGFVLLTIQQTALLAFADNVDPPGPSMHTVFTTECTPYFNWQTLGLLYSHHKAGQPGPVTRLMSCTDQDITRFRDLEGVPTHIAPSWTHHPITGDTYSGINKPVAVLDWLQKTQPQEEYILIIDADMIMRKPMLPSELGAGPGWAVSAFFGYMAGVNNKLALKHVPHVLPRNDSLAGPWGRRGDQVGGFTLMKTSDLQRVAPLWVNFSTAVREDPDAWNLTGDAFTTHPGEKPWISEMYGYSYGCSSADVWHKTDQSAMLYPGYTPGGLQAMPRVLHYGLRWDIPGSDWEFDKHWYQDFDVLACPPWPETKAPDKPKQGLFRHPPHPSTLTSHGLGLLRDLLAIETIATVNEAICEYHQKHCPAADDMERLCAQALEISGAVDAALKQVESDPQFRIECDDTDDRCSAWAKGGECDKNPGFMRAQCRLACGVCHPTVPDHKVDIAVHIHSQDHATPDDEANATVSLSNVKALEDHPVRMTHSKEGQTTAAMLANATRQQTAVFPPPVSAKELPNDLPRSTDPAKSGADSSHKANPASPINRLGIGRGQRAPTKKLGKRDGGKMRGTGQMETAQETMQRLQQACTRNTALTMQQVKACLEAASRGQAYAEGHTGDQQLQATEDATQQLQQQLRSQSEQQMQEEQQAGSNARQLQEGRGGGKTRPPDVVQQGMIATFMASGGDLGLMLFAAIGLLWWCFVRRRGRSSKPYRRMD